MTTVLKSKSKNETKCVACFEPIMAGAKICPHCRSAQTLHRWHVFSQSLKWVGGIVTIISLMIGGVTLSRFYLDWQEQRDAISELVKTADWLIKTEDYSQAWKMFEQAAELNPSSALVRNNRFKLAKLWIRDFKVEDNQKAAMLKAITEILYRGLPDASADDEATILAHIGYVKLKLSYNKRDDVFTDIKALLKQALAKSPNNTYANAIYARLLLSHRPSSLENLKQAESFYNKALSFAKNEKPFVRKMQIYGLERYIDKYTDDSTVHRASMIALLKACITIMKTGETQPDNYVIRSILNGYGHHTYRGNADHVDELATSLPTQDHLDVYEWLLKTQNNTNDYAINESTYIRGRLNEAIGNKELALNYYHSLFNVEPQEKLRQRVEQSIHRLNGKLPVRTRKRNFIDDPVDETNIEAFHIDSLKNFEPELSGENFRQAIAYFESQAKRPPEDSQSLLKIITEQTHRVRESLLLGDETKKMDAYTTGFNSWHHDNVRHSLISLTLLHSTKLNSLKQFDKSIAQLTDVLKLIKNLDESWRPMQGKIEYELARTYAMLATRNQNKQDTEQAMQYLLNSVNLGAIEHKHASWDQIKSDDFSLLKDDKRYQKLIRGR
jgi:hypothetical protein